MSGPEASAALKAVMEVLDMSGQDEAEPPESSLLVPMLRHQKLALAWMCRREASRRVSGGILADDQGLGKTVTTIGLILAHPRGGDYLQDIKQEGDSDEELEALMAAAGAATGSRAAAAAAAGAGAVSSRPEVVDLLESDDEDLRGGAPAAAAAAAAASGTATPIKAEPQQQQQATDDSSDEGDVQIISTPAKPTHIKPEQQQQQQQQQPNHAVGLLAAKPPLAGGAKPHHKSSKAALAAANKAAAVEAAERSMVPGGTLVVCPTSLLHQWARELRHKVHPAAGCEVHVYHAKDKAVSPEGLTPFTVVLTTYGTMAQEAPLKDRQATKSKKAAAAAAAAAGSDPLQDATAAAAAAASSSKAGSGSGSRAGTVHAAAGGPLFAVMWHRVVLDEAQSIKNASTLAAHAAWSLHARHRWCLSGTPIQNSVDDLFSYFKFLRYEPFNHPKAFKTHIKEEIAHNPAKGFRKLQALLRAVLLRRTKGSTIGGQPIIALPERRQQLLKIEFSRDEAAFYKQVEAEAVESLRKMQDEAEECLAARLEGSAGGDVAGEGLGMGLGLGFSCLVCGSGVRPGDAYRGVAVEAAAAGDSGGSAAAAAGGKGGGRGGGARGKSPAAAMDQAWKSSTKVDKVLQLLREIQQRNLGIAAASAASAGAAGAAAGQAGQPRPEKVIVFSQWTGMLDLLEVPLRKAGLGFRRLDGTMTVAARERAIADFESCVEVMALIVSLKAAALGLNLTVANHVVLLDLWWNPTTEEQAIDRAHRIGQTRPVQVTRITIPGTVEERILELQEKKRAIVDAALAEGADASAAANRLTMDDLFFLFGGSGS
ncbi:hypothetical protein OEZ85_003842 [Tetradesmus obliquus]|uniref:Helicase C-terminal domain-containing protein n=1 Tax=Tetradesmus obliquus TaxID=3088 RepID=A0ABY8UD58_TETOB|nr:hypothetical protein OEZ85_003842 [Tetradesmus obliquus]